MTDNASAPSRPRPGERLFRRLTVFNTAAILLGCGLLLLAAIIFRPYIPQAVGNFVKKQIYGSVAVERVQDWLPAALRVKPSLPTFQIYLPPATLRETELLAKRLKAQGFMTEEDEIWFPAKFSAAGRTYDVDIRLRGVMPAHWSGPKKSWTVKFKKGQRFNGYRRIDIVVPGDRGYETESVVDSLARKAGLLTPDSGFVTVRTNGVDMGLYFWFEHLTAEMLERHGYPGGVLLQRRHPAYVEPGFERMGVDFFERKDHLFEARHAEGAARGRVLGRWRRFMEMIRTGGGDLWSQVPYYLDIEKFVRWNAVVSMLGHRHAMIPGNLKWFFNPTTGLFEPVMYDVAFPVQIDTWSEQGRREGGPLGSFDARGFSNVIVNRLLRIPEVQHLRNRVLWELLNDPDFDLEKEAAGVLERILPAMSQGLSAVSPTEAEKIGNAHLTALRNNRKTLRNFLAHAVAMVQPQARGFDEGTVFDVSIATEGMSPLRIVKWTMTTPAATLVKEVEASLERVGSGTSADVPVDVQRDGNHLTLTFGGGPLLWSERNAELRVIHTRWTLRLKVRGLAYKTLLSEAYPSDMRLILENAVTGATVKYPRIMEAALAFPDDGAQAVSALTMKGEDFIAASGLPFALEGDALALGPGEYRISRDLILPAGKGLVLKGGVVLRLDPEVSILTHGPLTVSGTRDDPVRIERAVAGEPWGVIAVVRAKGLSTVDRLILAGGGEAWINGMRFSGQLNFFHSDVRIRNSRFAEASGDDSVNVKYGRVEIAESRFVANSSDGFDGDFVDASIAKSVFANNGGDGLDFSGSKTVVTDSLLRGMGDKAVSLGEASTATIFNSVLRDSVIGIASKDRSRARLFASVLVANKTALAAYQKKPMFGGGALEAVSTVLWNNGRDFQVDEVSSIELTGVGLERRQKAARPIPDGTVVGDLGRLFTDDGNGDIRYVGGPASPFAKGPTVALPELSGLPSMTLSESPLGLVHPLPTLQ